MRILNRDNPIEAWELRGRPFLFLNLSYFLVFAHMGLLYLYPLALKAMGTDPRTMGWIIGIFSVAAVASRPFMGKLAIRRGEYGIMASGLCLCLLACMGYLIILSVGPLLIGIRFIHGLGFSAFVGGSFSLMAKRLSPLDRGAGFSIVGASIMAGVAAAPSAGEILVGRWGFQALYLAATGAILLSWIAASMALRGGSLAWSNTKGSPVSYGHLLKDRRFVFVLASTLVFAHSQATVTHFLALLASHKQAQSGPFFFTASATAIVVLLGMGRFIDKYGEATVSAFAYPLLSLSLLLIPTSIVCPLGLPSSISFGVSVAFLFSIHNALAASHGTLQEKPAVMSLFTGVYDAGYVTGAMVSGWFIHHISIDLLFVATGSFTLMGLLLILRSFKA